MKNWWYVKAFIQGIFALIIITALMLLLAGRLDYWQGWAFGIFCFLNTILKAVLFSGKTELGKERLKPGPGTKWWDKIFWALIIILTFAIIVVGSLDARYGWTKPLPVQVYVDSYLLMSFGIFIFTWGMWVNKFFSSTVRIQKERKQKVIQAGPYRCIRHPGYVGGILMFLTMALVLGSFWALIPSAILSISMIIRTYLEDNLLKKELKGYKSYAKKVRYRLLPGVW